MLKKTLSTLLLGLTLTAGCEALGLGGDNKDSSDKTTNSDDRISHAPPPDVCPQFAAVV